MEAGQLRLKQTKLERGSTRPSMSEFARKRLEAGLASEVYGVSGLSSVCMQALEAEYREIEAQMAHDAAPKTPAVPYFKAYKAMQDAQS